LPLSDELPLLAIENSSPSVGYSTASICLKIVAVGLSSASDEYSPLSVSNESRGESHKLAIGAKEAGDEENRMSDPAFVRGYVESKKAGAHPKYF